MAAASGFVVSIGGLCKQPSFLHLVPLFLWWLAAGIHAPNTRCETAEARASKARRLCSSLLPAVAFVAGALTPIAAVLVCFASVGAWDPFVYYALTYNHAVYMGPIGMGYAIESTYVALRVRGPYLLITVISVAWAWSRFASKRDGFGVTSLSKAYVLTAVTTTTVLHMVFALVAASGTFRFWDHYYITALPWIGLLFGVLFEDSFLAFNPRGPNRAVRSTIVFVAAILSISFVLRHVTTLWLTGQRLLGRYYGNPTEEPIARHIQAHTTPTQSVFVWGFSPEIYTNANRRPASRYVFTSFVAGTIPWLSWLTFEQEQRFVVPGSREILLGELESEQPPIIVDVANSLQGRSIRHVPELAAYVERHYCYRDTIFGGTNKIGDIYHRRSNDDPCGRQPPPLFKPK